MQRETDEDRGPFSWFRFDLYRTTVLVDNHLGNREAKAEALGLGAKKRLKDLIPVLRSNARAGVRKG